MNDNNDQRYTPNEYPGVRPKPDYGKFIYTDYSQPANNKNTNYNNPGSFSKPANVSSEPVARKKKAHAFKFRKLTTKGKIKYFGLPAASIIIVILLIALFSKIGGSKIKIDSYTVSENVVCAYDTFNEAVFSKDSGSTGNYYVTFIDNEHKCHSLDSVTITDPFNSSATIENIIANILTVNSDADIVEEIRDVIGFVSDAPQQNVVLITLLNTSEYPSFKGPVHTSVVVKTASVNGPCVPESAVIEENGQKYVLKLDGKVVKKAVVETGLSENGLVYIATGVSVNDVIVKSADGAQLSDIEDGAKVKVKNTSKDKDKGEENNTDSGETTTASVADTNTLDPVETTVAAVEGTTVAVVENTTGLIPENALAQ